MMTKRSINERVATAAEKALQKNGYVTVFDVLMRIGWLEPVHVERWQRGYCDTLEDLMMSTRPRRQNVLRILGDWACDKRLQESSVSYIGNIRCGDDELQITPDKDAELEAAYRRMYTSGDASPRKQKRIKDKVAKRPDLVVFSVVRETACSDCGNEICKGGFLSMDKGAPLCLSCADLDRLVFLPSGDATLTRRARKYSKLSAVVVQKSRARRRYERQGALVEQEALERAEHECLEDADERAERRRREAKRRLLEDLEYTEDVFVEIRRNYPGCPPEMAREIAEHTTVRGSGRVGRTAAARDLDEQKLKLAVIAAIRHSLTPYDEYLMSGIDREDARRKVQEQIEKVLRDWHRAGQG